MPKHLIRKYLPDPEKIASLPGLGPLRHRLEDPNLWHLNRRSASGAVFWGLWFAFLPMPFHTVPAVIVAIMLRLNLPLCVLMVWFNNPFTLLPILWLSYHLGALLVPQWAMHPPPHLVDFARLVESWFHHGPPDKHPIRLARLLEPVLLGMMVNGFIFGAVGAMSLNLLWRQHVRRAWTRRRKARKPRDAATDVR